MEQKRAFFNNGCMLNIADPIFNQNIKIWLGPLRKEKRNFFLKISKIYFLMKKKHNYYQKYLLQTPNISAFSV